MYKWSNASASKLAKVHPDLQKVMNRALEILYETGGPDVKVLEGKRTLARQKQLVAKGASWTMRSRHLTGHAVDLGALLGGQVSWHWDLYDQVAEAVRQAAIDVGVPIEWGAAWSDITKADSAAEAKAAYIASKRKHTDKKKRRPILDGPHYQLPWKTYPS